MGNDSVFRFGILKLLEFLKSDLPLTVIMFWMFRRSSMRNSSLLFSSDDDMVDYTTRNSHCPRRKRTL